ncbi:polyphosphate kinase 1 [Feifania hominis]|uniref:Polyphosphate kinase n=1 Tax=Feifania hominis TaxID=2763660 RepID=A0A926HUF1_9FIRM|nr:polyphosphate kinase 1 [Feifania hominis]MBC8535880.1 polyphosphate kinase 1 [Feifania hominis]
MASNFDYSYTQNRELSWLRFNARVLEQAQDPTVPLYEKLKFISIFTSNLDEFFMIRVGSLHDLSLLPEAGIDNKSGLSPAQQIREILKAVAPLYKLRDQIMEELEPQLREHDIYRLTYKELSKKERHFLADYFKDVVLPVLSPQIVDSHHPFPHLPNKALTVAMLLKSTAGTNYGIIPIPQSLPPIVFLPGAGVRYITLERVVAEHADSLFKNYETVAKSIVCVTRNADISPDDEGFDDEDYRRHMKKILKKRARLAPVRLEVQGEIDSALASYLLGRLGLKKDQVFKSRSPLAMGYVYLLEENFSASTARAIVYPAFAPQPPAGLVPGEPMARQIAKRDRLFSYPYEQMDPFLRLLREAAYDPAVISVKITIYRLARKAKIIDYLVAAAENGKEVTVLMELRARFDEQNNIMWAERLEEAGCKVIYGFEGFKVHSKICLITRREKNRVSYITQVGTGNYNEKTAKLYTDYSLLTADEEIGRDAAEFFKNMLISDLEGEYHQLIVAPAGLKSSLLRLVDEEIDRQRSTGDGRIFLKLNSLTDREVIDKLSQASQAGVKITLLIRGICCLLPGIAGRTENIAVYSIVGRFLEHSRIYCFGSGERVRLYISSADMMTRNTERRVEIACPVHDRHLRARILNMVDCMLRDNVKARILQSDGTYRKPQVQGDPFDSQLYFMEEAVEQAALSQPGSPSPGLRARLSRLFRRK